MSFVEFGCMFNARLNLHSNHSGGSGKSSFISIIINFHHEFPCGQQFLFYPLKMLGHDARNEGVDNLFIHWMVFAYFYLRNVDCDETSFKQIQDASK